MAPLRTESATLTIRMPTLSRTVRFSINDADAPITGSNGFGGVPSMRGLGRYYELHITCEGAPDAATGYLLNIKDIDTAARDAVIPFIAEACHRRAHTSPESLLPRIVDLLRQRLGAIATFARWNLTPYYSVEMNASSPHALLRQSFDISAAHRLHAPALNDQQNREMFGKCNHPSGHGHNYRIEPCVALSLDPAREFGLAELEALVARHIIEPFDHKHFNLDTPEFATKSGLNPTIENIARVFYDRLQEPVRESSRGHATLRSVTVWETDRTSSTYPGEC